MKKTDILLTVLLVGALVGFVIWVNYYFNSDQSPKPNQINLPQELRQSNLKDLPFGKEVETYWTAMHVDSSGYCWIDIDQSYEPGRSMKVLRTEEGWKVKVDSRTKYNLWKKGTLRNQNLEPVVGLEIIKEGKTND